MGDKNDEQLYPQNIVPAPDVTKRMLEFLHEWSRQRCLNFYWDGTGALDFVVADVQMGFSAAGIANSFYIEHQSNYTINSIWRILKFAMLLLLLR